MSFGAAFSRALSRTATQAGDRYAQQRERDAEQARQAALMDLSRQQLAAQQAEREAARQRQTALDQREFAEGGYSAVDPLANRAGQAMDAVPLPDMGRLSGMTMTQGRAPQGRDVAFNYGGQEFAKTGKSVREQELEAARTQRAQEQSLAAGQRERELASQQDFQRQTLGQQQEFTAAQNAANREMQRQIAAMRTATSGAAPALRPAPAGVVMDIQGNVRQLRTLDEALTQLDDNPRAVGMKSRWTPDVLLDRLPLPGFKDGATARAGIADVGSLEIRDRSGAAVTASEFPRLRPFIPSADDPAEVVKMKLRRMRDIIAEETEARASYYGPDNGFAPVVDPASLRAAPTDGRVTQPVGGRPPLSGGWR
jgi:hypothetical protein